MADNYELELNESNELLDMSSPDNMELNTSPDNDISTQYSSHCNDTMAICSRENIVQENKNTVLLQGSEKESDIRSETSIQQSQTKQYTSEYTHSRISMLTQQHQKEQGTSETNSSIRRANSLPHMELNRAETNSNISISSISVPLIETSATETKPSISTPNSLPHDPMEQNTTDDANSAFSTSPTESYSVADNTSSFHINIANSMSSENISEDDVECELNDIELESNTSFSHIIPPPNYCRKSCEKLIQSEADLEIQYGEIPLRFKRAHCDAVVIYCEKDETMALLFKDLVEKFVTLNDGTKPRICTVDGDDYPQWGQSRFQQWEEVVNSSTYMFLFMTEHFVDDAWASLQYDGCLQASIDDPDKRWCVVPVHSIPKNQHKIKVPWGIRSLKGLFIDKMFRGGKRLQDVELSEITMDNMYPFFIMSMAELLNSNLHKKKNRIAAQEQDLTEWKEEEVERRSIRLIQYRYNNEIRAAKAERQRKLREEVMVKRRQDALRMVQEMTLPTLDDIEVEQSDLRTSHETHPSPSTTPCSVINIINSTGVSIGNNNQQDITHKSRGDLQSHDSDYDDESCDTDDIIIERTQDIHDSATIHTAAQFEPDHATLSDETFVKSVE